MKNLKRYNDFINESNSDNNKEIYEFIKNKIIPFAINFAFEESDIVGERGVDDHWMEGGDLALWNDNEKPTKDDWDKFWEYVKSVTFLYDDVISDNWDGEGDVEKVFYDNLDGKVKDMFKEAYMKEVDSPDITLPKLSKPKGDELYQYIIDKYVEPVEDELDIRDFSDEFEYYDNVIFQAVEEYMSQEDKNADIDELTDGLKNYWQPI
jgi:hypothetical protein